MPSFPPTEHSPFCFLGLLAIGGIIVIQSPDVCHSGAIATLLECQCAFLVVAGHGVKLAYC